MITGIDVHGAKGVINWDAVRASGRTFAFAKASEGRTFVDKRVRVNVDDARAAGMQVGCYHFARPDTGNSPVDEAHHFLRQIDGLAWDLPPVLDIERGDGPLNQWALSFLGAIEAGTGVIPIVYTYLGFVHGRLTDQALGRYPLWLAAYRSVAVETNPARMPQAPTPWAHWAIWQHWSRGTVPGVPGNCDLNQAIALPGVGTVAQQAPTPASQPIVTTYPEALVKSIDIQIDTDAQGKGYADLPDVPARTVVNVMCNTGNPTAGGYKPIPDVARIALGAGSRIIVEEAVPSGRIDVTVWIAA